MATPQWAVQAPDGKVIQFPDNFSQQDVEREMSNLYPAKGVSTSPTSAPTVSAAKAAWQASDRPKVTASKAFQADYDPNSLVKNFLANVGEQGMGAIKGAVDMGKDLLSNPNWFRTMLEGQRPSTMQKYVTEPGKEMGRKAISEEALGAGDYSGGEAVKGMGYGLAAALPLVGPWAASLGEQAGSGDISGAAGGLVGGLAGAKVLGEGTKAAAELPKEAMRFLRRATSMEQVAQAASGVYQSHVQPAIQTLQAAIQNEGARTIQQAIQADKAAQLVPGRGSISPAAAVTESAKAIEDTGHMPTPQTRALLSRLNNSSTLTLEEAKNLRSDFGAAASKADRAGNAKLGKILWSAYDQLGEGMKGRIQELQGTTKPYDHYNNEFKAYYELNKGIAGSMQEAVADRHEAIPKLREFADADLTELKDQAKKYGLDPAKFDEAQANARTVMGANKSIGGGYRQSVHRLTLGGGVAAATALSVYAVAHGAGLYGLVPLLGASYVAGKVAGYPDQMKTGEILRRLEVDPESFQVRTPVEGPQYFDYPNQDELYSKPPAAPTAPPALPTPADVSSDVAKLQALRATARPQRSVQPEMSPLEKPLWQESVFGQKPSEDIGSKVRAANPEPTRAETKAARLKKTKGSQRGQ